MICSFSCPFDPRFRGPCSSWLASRRTNGHETAVRGRRAHSPRTPSISRRLSRPSQRQEGCEWIEEKLARASAEDKAAQAPLTRAPTHTHAHTHARTHSRTHTHSHAHTRVHMHMDMHMDMDINRHEVQPRLCSLGLLWLCMCLHMHPQESATSHKQCASQVFIKIHSHVLRARCETFVRAKYARKHTGLTRWP